MRAITIMINGKYRLHGGCGSLDCSSIDIASKRLLEVLEGSGGKKTGWVELEMLAYCLSSESFNDFRTGMGSIALLA